MASSACIVIKSFLLLKHKYIPKNTFVKTYIHAYNKQQTDFSINIEQLLVFCYISVLIRNICFSFYFYIITHPYSIIHTHKYTFIYIRKSYVTY